MQRIVITGSNGLLGQKIVDLFSRGNYPLMLISLEPHSVFDEEVIPYRSVDTTNRQLVRKVVDEFEPDVIIHTAAITNVDQCETERKLAWQVNVVSVENLTYAAKLVGAHLIHLSTDYVFDGKTGPYTELDRPNPICYYGRTKLASENLLRTSGVTSTIVRTMVLYGTGHSVKPNFALWVLQSLHDGKPIRVVDDQIGNPTLVDDLAYGILKIVELGRTGMYNIAGADLVSRYDFAIALARVFALNKKLISPMKTDAIKQPAPRPLKSGLITLKAQVDLGLKMSGMEQGLTIFKNQINARKKKDNA
jgi:dTDP-4-dehydrorhamnose reductase